RLEGHSAEIYGSAFTPDGERAVTSSLDGTLRLWRVSDGALIAVLRGHKEKLRSVAINPVDGTIASGGDDGEIRLWDGSTGNFLRVLANQGTQIYALTFSPDGKKLLSGVGDLSGDRNCHVFDVATGQELVTYKEHDNIAVATGISPDGRLAVTGGGNRNDIHVWDLATGKRIAGSRDNKPLDLGGYGSIVFAVGFTRDGRRILWGNTDPCPLETSCPELMGALQWKLRLPTEQESLGRPEPIAEDANDAVRAIIASGARSLALRAGGDQNKPDAILDIRTGDQTLSSIQRGQRDGYRHSAYSFTADGGTVVSGGNSGT